MTKPWKAFLVLAAVLILSSLRMGMFARWSTDVPPPDQWPTDAAHLYAPWLHRTSHGVWHLSGTTSNGVWHLLRTPDAGARIWKLLALQINGQWDPRFLDFSAICLFGLAVGVFLGAVLAEATAGAALVIASATVAFLCLPVAMHDGMGAPSLWTGLFLLLSVLHLSSAVTKPGSGRWWLGHLAGLANVLSSTAGLASPVSILVWMALRGSRCEDGERRRTSLALANGGLVALGLAFIAASRQRMPHFDFSHFAAAAAWPLPWRLGALITIAPAIALLIATGTRFARTRLIHGLETASMGRRSRNVSLACLAACWALAATAAIAGGTAPGGAIPPSLVCVILVVQASALLALPAERARAWTIKGLAVVIWLALAADGLARQGQPVEDPTERARQANAQTSAVRRFLADRRLAELEVVFSPAALAKEIGDVLSDPQIQRILPPSLRPSLPVVASAGTHGFAPDAAPPEDGKPQLLPVWGTWDGAHDEPSRFVSAPLQTSAPLLQIYIAGTLDPPASSLVLERVDGGLIPPITQRADATTRWRIINFRAPKSPFRIVAAQSDSTHTLAFSAPIESARWPRLARAACDAWKAVLVLGASLALLGLAGGMTTLEGDGAGTRRAIALVRTHGPWLALFGYTLVFAGFLDSCAAGADSSGYLNSAKLLFKGHLFPTPRWLPGIHARLDMLSPLGFAIHRGVITPSYPAGFPLMVAALAHLSSLSVAIPVVILLHLLLGVVATERLGRISGLSRPGALVVAAVVALCPIYIFSGLQPMTDVPSLAWVTAALYLALASRVRPAMAVWAGAACGVAVFLRPANAICLLPVAIAIGVSRPRLLRWAAGGLPAATLWAAYNYRVYGSPWVTGYGNAGYLFSWSWLLPSAGNYARSLTACLSPLIWIAAAGPWCRRLSAPARAALSACAVCYLGFYAFYSCTHESWWILRFVLPAFPALAILAAGTAESAVGALARRASRAAGGLAALFAAAALVSVVGGCFELPILGPADDDAVYRNLSLWIDRTAPKDAVIIAYQASGALFYYTEHPLLRAGRPTQPAANDAIRALRDAGTPVYAVIFPWDEVTSIALLPGHWTDIGNFGSATVWKLSEAAKLTPAAAQSAGSGSLFENTAGQIGPGRRG